MFSQHRRRCGQKILEKNKKQSSLVILKIKNNSRLIRIKKLIQCQKVLSK